MRERMTQAEKVVAFYKLCLVALALALLAGCAEVHKGLTGGASL